MAATKSALWRQTNTLANKNFTILLTRHVVSTLYTALMLPIILTIYLGIGQRLTNPNSEFGIGEPRSIRSLDEGLSAAQGSRDTVVFINNGLSGGDIDRVIDTLAQTVDDAGKNATRLEDPSELGYVCRTSFRGTTPCYGAVVFHSSPDEGNGGIWNYTLRADAAFGLGYEVDQDNNDAQVYTIPLQRAVDSAIARLNSTLDDDVLGSSEEWGFTDQTEEERQAEARKDYQQTFVNYLGVAFVLALMGVTYHLPGHVATEREKGLSQLIDAMMPTAREWEAQAARILSTHYSFATIYVTGWVAAGLIAKFTVWEETFALIPLALFLLAGLALTSQAILGAVFFSKAQLSGVVNSLVYVLLGVLAQALPSPSTAVVAILGLLFTPCSFVFFIKNIARFEGEGRAMNLLEGAPGSASDLPGIVFLIFMIIQMFVYPVIAVFFERSLHGVASESRSVWHGDSQGGEVRGAVRVQGLTKIYRPGFLRRLFAFVSKPREPTVAVDSLSLTAEKGQILALLGANGSGKSTTLDAIAGISRFNQGKVSIDASGGIGIAPQKNVLWDELTVSEHLRIFNALKSPRCPASADELALLIEQIGLSTKTKAQVKTLSGGQKRKLQLGMMLTGGSAVCCIDEVSSGIDPLSRRKIWDILLSERGRRTIIMTTHFLDEADLLADRIAILSKGSLRAEGSAVALKNQLGAGYRIHVLNARQVRAAPEIEGVHREVRSNTIVYTAPSSSLAAEVIRALEAARIEYRLSNPTIEDVFLQVAEEAQDERLTARPAPLNPADSSESQPGISEKDVSGGATGSLGLQTGRPIGFVKQTLVLVRRRFTLFKTNWIPFVVAFLVPIIAAAVMQILIRDESAVSCSPSDQSRAEGTGDFMELFDDAVIVAGPESSFPGSSSDVVSGGSGNISLDLQGTFSGFRSYIEENRKDVFPGGWWLGEGDSPATFAYRADDQSVYTAVFAQNFLNSMRTNISIATTYSHFDLPAPSSLGDSLQLAIYFTIALGIAPAFFGMYPNLERRSHVRSLQYSSGVRSLPLWAAHLLFDSGIFIVAMIVAAVALVASSDMWYSPGYLFPVFILYALASVLLSYLFSLMLGSQLATFAAIMAYNGVGFAIYLIAFLFIITFSNPVDTDQNILLGHYIISVFFPGGSLCRALMIGLNVFSVSCSGDELISYPGEMNAYGGPILYLAIQTVLFFGILLLNDSGVLASRERAKKSDPSTQQPVTDDEAADDLVQAHSTAGVEGLQVKNLTKGFGKLTAVDNVSFNVRHGEVFALLGPNGAGKSTTISLIRGDMKPSKNGGDVFVEGVSVNGRRALARSHLGICPQFDALDTMSVRDHLRHYARVRGIADVDAQVSAVIRAVGLDAHQHAMAPHLSGGNKRKLSLGIALTGNPSVILLDEPSSGLDAAAKRVMWRTLEALVPGRSILLTTHSMEEADALAGRAGILARRMLAAGSVDTLRERFGGSLYVHLVTRTAPHSSDAEMDALRSWVLDTLPGADVEPDTYHGQMRFSVPASSVPGRDARGGGATSDIGRLVVLLEENRERLGIENHSVSPATLNDVFLSIVGRHDVQEEGYGGEQEAAAGKVAWWQRREVWRKLCWPF